MSEAWTSHMLQQLANGEDGSDVPARGEKTCTTIVVLRSSTMNALDVPGATAVLGVVELELTQRVEARRMRAAAAARGLPRHERYPAATDWISAERRRLSAKQIQTVPPLPGNFGGRASAFSEAVDKGDSQIALFTTFIVIAWDNLLSVAYLIAETQTPMELLSFQLAKPNSAASSAAVREYANTQKAITSAYGAIGQNYTEMTIDMKSHLLDYFMQAASESIVRPASYYETLPKSVNEVFVTNIVHCVGA
ncbi:hypothetical protein DFH11DRAFT_1545550 [Phellopilus nigrolimitatus]|nr:hypothetical protein DFH11DRAFT_1545550 [Phellopilus nigrolimitatus]